MLNTKTPQGTNAGLIEVEKKKKKLKIITTCKFGMFCVQPFMQICHYDRLAKLAFLTTSRIE